MCQQVNNMKNAVDTSIRKQESEIQYSSKQKKESKEIYGLI